MMEMTSSDVKSGGMSRMPIALASVALVLVVIGAGAVMLGRAYSGTAPEQERITAARLLQARTAETSEQLVEKTKAMEATQQETIDQLQVAQDQLQTTRRLLAAQQADTKRLTEQIAGLTEQIESLRQSFASVQSNEAAAQASAPTTPTRKPGGARSARRKRGRTQG